MLWFQIEQLQPEEREYSWADQMMFSGYQYFTRRLHWLRRAVHEKIEKSGILRKIAEVDHKCSVMHVRRWSSHFKSLNVLF